jgi:hypothetical protein
MSILKKKKIQNFLFLRYRLVFDVLSTKSSVCLNITIGADADLICKEGNKQKKKNESGPNKKKRE